MKIIFLDIDGVLIPLMRREKGLKSMNGVLADVPESTAAALIKILRATGAHIVISSAWRHNWQMCAELLKYLPGDCEERLVWGRVITKTPSHTGGGRSTEILMWLDQYHKTCKAGCHVKNWIAIDDEGFDMKAIKRIGKLHKTDMHVGLTDADADLIIEKLLG